jgi:CRP-like cAMP-binding protein
MDDDLLVSLPISTVTHHAPNEKIYSEDQPCAHLYTVVSGMVKLVRHAAQRQPVILGFCRTGDLFGQSVFITPAHTEEAVAVENTAVMSWAAGDVEQLLDRRPRVTLGLLKTVVRREIDFTKRLESLANDSVAVRLAKSLLDLAERFGTPAEGGTATIRGVTHESLAQYIGSSRALVGLCLVEFRHQQLLRYSHKKMVLYRDSLREWIRMTAQEEPGTKAV